MGIAANAQDKTYILDINKIYTDAKAFADGDGTEEGKNTDKDKGPTLQSGTKYDLNAWTVTQDIFTVVSKNGRTYRVDLANGEGATYDYGDYTATYRLEPNGASNKTGGRQMFVEVANKGVLYVGAWGNDGRNVAITKAKDKTTFIDLASIDDADVIKKVNCGTLTAGVAFKVALDAGLYCVTQDAGIYYGYLKFVEGETIVSSAITDATAADANGSIELSATEAAEGDEVTVTVTPAEGYELDKLTLSVEGEEDQDITSALKFTMPAKAVSVAATFKAVETTAVAVVNANEVVSVEYINLAGMRSAAPQKGINIVRTKYADGTVKTVKIVK